MYHWLQYETMTEVISSRNYLYQNADMKNDTFKLQSCSIARALELVGEWWSLLIVREAFLGTRRFNEFEKNLGIAKNILARRLAKLVEGGVLERTAVVGKGNPRDYTLTARGRDLLPVIVALMQWGDRWSYGNGQTPLCLRDRKNGQELPAITVRSASGEPLSFGDILVEPGPSANDAIRRRFSIAPQMDDKEKDMK
jgi:DNA-binding HxlR family transcriptional regulator